MEGSMITATTWVPRGFAANHPKRIQIDEAEFDRIAGLAKLQLEDAQEDLAEAEAERNNGSVMKDDDDLGEYDLDNYDEPTEEEKENGTAMGMFGNVKSLAYHRPGEADPYIVMQEGEEEGDEEREELEILNSDNILVVGRVEDEVAHLEVYVYEDEADNLYVHHDIMLPAIPLCIEWLDLPVGVANLDKNARGNYVAIGSTDPVIEIWNLDVVDSMFPDAILGASGEEKKRKKKKQKANDDYHVGPVQALAVNRQHRNLLASGSADKTLKLWDLTTSKCAKSYNYHTGQVCALAWNTRDSTTLLSGSYDRTVVWIDMRAPDAKKPSWGVESDVEHIKWDPHDPNYFYISTENGVIHFHDSRKAPSLHKTKSVWTLQAHDKAISSFDINPIIPGFLATGSMDKTVKLWNTQASTGGPSMVVSRDMGGPSMVVSRDMGVGKVFSCTFAPDAEVGFRLSVAGSKGVVTVWDTSTNAGIRRVFGNRVKVKKGKEGKEDLIVQPEASDDEGESDSGEEEDNGSGDDSNGDV